MNQAYRDANHGLVMSLVEGAESGRLLWEPGARANEFIAGYKGKYTLVVRRHQEGDSFAMSDESGREMLRVSSDEDEDVGRLFEAAQRSTLKVDAAIREIVADFGPAHEGDDIPF